MIVHLARGRALVRDFGQDVRRDAPGRSDEVGGKCTQLRASRVGQRQQRFDIQPLHLGKRKRSFRAHGARDDRLQLIERLPGFQRNDALASSSALLKSNGAGR